MELATNTPRRKYSKEFREEAEKIVAEREGGHLPGWLLSDTNHPVPTELGIGVPVPVRQAHDPRGRCVDGKGRRRPEIVVLHLRGRDPVRTLGADGPVIVCVH
jgi:hypothetical protein